MPRPVVLDTNVLFPPTLRDTLLRCAEVGLYFPLWSPDILNGLRTNLLSDADLPPQSVDRLILAMNRSFPAAFVDNYQHLIPNMTNHPRDRHVLATAVFVKADLILTFNLRHFRPQQLAPHSIKAQSPDEFLAELATTSYAAICDALDLQVRPLQRPPRSIGDILTRLDTSAPTFARLMRNRMLSDGL